MCIGFIYEWVNTNNGMKYLGSHKGNADDGYTGSGKRFLNAVRKYGIDNFCREIVEYVDHEDDLLVREQYYLDERNCAKSKRYYNISPTAGGGNTGSGKKISNTHKKAFKNGERTPWCKGKKMTDEQKKNLPIDEWLVILPRGEEKYIKNMLEFCRQHKLNPSAMSAVARGKRGHHKGYKCKKLSNNRDVEYEYSEYKYLTHEEKIKINSESVKAAKAKSAAPKIEYNGVVYYSLVNAMAETGLSRFLLVKNGKLLRND